MEYTKEQKKAQLDMLEHLWYTSSDEGQERRYEMIYDKIVVNMNRIMKDLKEVSKK